MQPEAGEKNGSLPASVLIPTPLKKAKADVRHTRRQGTIMKKFRIRYETRLLYGLEGTETVAASGKGQAMLAVQAMVHPDERLDEPYFHFEPLTIRQVEPGRYEVAFRTKIEKPVSGEVDVEAADADKAVSKARLAVHQEFIPPKCFKAVAVEEIGGA